MHVSCILIATSLFKPSTVYLGMLSKSKGQILRIAAVLETLF